MGQIRNASGLLKAVGGFVAALPPLAVITGLVDIPPTLGQLVKLITVPISIVVVVLIFVLGPSIVRMSAKHAAITFGGCVLFGALATVFYYNFAGAHVVAARDQPVVIPLNPSVEIRTIMEPYDEDYAEALENASDNERLRVLMEREAGSAVAVMVLMMVLAQVLMVAGMVGAIWKIVVDQEAIRQTASSSATGKSGSAG